MYVTKFKINSLSFIAYSDPKGIFSLFINTTPKTPKNFIELAPDDEKFFGLQNQREDYLKGKKKVFKIKHHTEGTPFQVKVWQALKEIPYGTTVSYKALAQHIGNELAVRAVGGANKLNPLPLIVPCHRVIQADGSLGGYACGVKVKKMLLDLEHAQPGTF